jgi:recombination protein RecA
VNLVLQAGGFDVVLFDLAEVPQEAIRRLPFTTWFRLQRAIEGGRTACVLASPAPVARSAGGVSIQLSRAGGFTKVEGGGRGAGTTWDRSADRVRRLAGLGINARVLRARQTDTGSCEIRVRD